MRIRAWKNVRIADSSNVTVGGGYVSSGNTQVRDCGALDYEAGGAASTILVVEGAVETVGVITGGDRGILGCDDVAISLGHWGDGEALVGGGSAIDRVVGHALGAELVI